MASKVKVAEFLKESNAIEGVYSEEALADAQVAWNYAMENDLGNPDVQITIDHVLGIHQRLMTNLESRIAGKFRTCAVYIGNRECPKPSSEVELTNAIKLQALDDLNDSKGKRELSLHKRDRLAKAKHVAFEHVHPFEDGNGRTGRILYNIHRLRLGLHVHTIFDAKKQSYYQWFKD